MAQKIRKRSGVPPTHPTKICSSSFLNVPTWLGLSLSLRRSLRSLRYRSPSRSSSGRGYVEAHLIHPVGLDRSDHEGQGKNTVLYTRHFAKSSHVYCFKYTAHSPSVKPVSDVLSLVKPNRVILNEAKLPKRPHFLTHLYLSLYAPVLDWTP